MTREEMERQLEDRDKTILDMNQERTDLLEEVQAYRSAARLYGIKPQTMLKLARSQIKTSEDNIRLIEKMQEVFELFRYVPEGLTEQEVVSAITQYDGDGSKPYCDLVCCGLSIIRKYLKKRSEFDEWRKGNLPESF